MLDVHLSANLISAETRCDFLKLGFREDVFEACKNCAPTEFHATAKMQTYEVAGIWDLAITALKDDDRFDGTLEQERALATTSLSGSRGTTLRPDSFPTCCCPSESYKVCDVHIRIKFNNIGSPAGEWLDRIGLASFRRTVNGETWTIYTATFDALDAGRSFFKFVEDHAPAGSGESIRIKLEKVDRVFRKPRNAMTLPLTNSNELEEWLRSVGGTWPKEASSSPRQQKRVTRGRQLQL